MRVDKHEYRYIPKFNLANYYHPSQIMRVDKHEYHYIPKFNLANYYHPSQIMSVDKHEYHYIPKFNRVHFLPDLKYSYFVSLRSFSITYSFLQN